jgi:hypothetical protein
MDEDPYRYIDRHEYQQLFEILLKQIHDCVSVEERRKLQLICSVCDGDMAYIGRLCDGCKTPICEECSTECPCHKECGNFLCERCIGDVACMRCYSLHCWRLPRKPSDQVCMVCNRARCEVCGKLPDLYERFNRMCTECQHKKKHTCTRCNKYEEDVLLLSSMCQKCTEKCKECDSPHLPKSMWCEGCKCKRCDNPRERQYRYSQYGMCRVCISIFVRCKVCGERVSLECVNIEPGQSRCQACELANRC